MTGTIAFNDQTAKAGNSYSYRLSVITGAEEHFYGETRVQVPAFALALRLAQHRLVGRETGRLPLLLLDDVFSELDRSRAAALIAHLPAGQAFMSSAVEIPAEADIERIFDVAPGRLDAR